MMTTMKRNIKYLLIAFVSLSVFSCGNKFLDESPKTSVGDSELVKSETDLDNACNGC